MCWCNINDPQCHSESQMCYCFDFWWIGGSTDVLLCSKWVCEKICRFLTWRDQTLQFHRAYWEDSSGTNAISLMRTLTTMSSSGIKNTEVLLALEEPASVKMKYNALVDERCAGSILQGALGGKRRDQCNIVDENPRNDALKWHKKRKYCWLSKSQHQRL